MKICIMGDTHWGYIDTHNKQVVELLYQIKEEAPDYIIHCGDIQSSLIFEAETLWRTVREILGWDVKIGAVLGNHDYWMEDSPFEAEKHHLEVFQSFGVDSLERNPVMLGEKVVIFGLTGWYYNDSVVTNDAVMIGDYRPAGRDYLRQKADVAFASAIRRVKDHIEDTPYRLLVTHFEFLNGANDLQTSNYMGENPRWEEFIGDFTHIISGHRHLPSKDFSCGPEGKQLYYNCGSHYNDPRYLMLEL